MGTKEDKEAERENKRERESRIVSMYGMNTMEA
jgi:hypothetical protein